MPIKQNWLCLMLLKTTRPWTKKKALADWFSQISNQSAITCSKLTIEILEQGVKYVQS